MTGEQLLLPLPNRPAYGQEDFLVSEANQRAIDAVDRFPDWPNPIMIVTGPEGSGKTHLAHVFQALADAEVLPMSDITADRLPAWFETRALILEDIDDIAALPDPDAFFLLVDTVLRRRISLFMTSRRPIIAWRVERLDTVSRLKLAQICALSPPDDALMSGVLVKLFHDRQVTVAPDVIRYIVERSERSFAAINAMVEKLDHKAMLHGRPITRALVREALSLTP